jgi:hypothetical protein
MRSVLRTVVTAAALATQPARGSVTQPHNRDGNLGRRLIQRSRSHTAPDVTAGRTASRLMRMLLAADGGRSGVALNATELKSARPSTVACVVAISFPISILLRSRHLALA